MTFDQWFDAWWLKDNDNVPSTGDYTMYRQYLNARSCALAGWNAHHEQQIQAET